MRDPFFGRPVHTSRQRLRTFAVTVALVATTAFAMALLWGAPLRTQVDVADVIGESSLGALMLCGLFAVTRRSTLGREFAPMAIGLLCLLLSCTLDVAEEWLNPQNSLASGFENASKTLGVIAFLIGVLLWHRRQLNMRASLEADMQKLEVASLTDPLSGLGNRSAMDDALQHALARQHPCVLLLLDIDNFKLHNDTWGHPEGDLVIQELARTIAEDLRGTDDAFRYGGEEFAVLLQGTTVRGAQVVAERIREAFAARVFQPEPGVRVHKTISIGLAMLHPADTLESWLARADLALYSAKRTGKNKVMLERDAPEPVG